MGSRGDEIIKRINRVFAEGFDVSQGQVIPNLSDLAVGTNEGRQLELAMLFVDIRSSTVLVDAIRRTTAAKMYKSYLWGVAKIVRANGGAIASYNGDGVLCAFSGKNKCSVAAMMAQHLVWLGDQVIRPKMEKVFESYALDDAKFQLGIGLDVGEVLVIRAGIRGEDNNETVWVGSPTNFAAKLAEFSTEAHWIHAFKEFHDKINETGRYSPYGDLAWEGASANGGIYRCGWWMHPDYQGKAPSSILKGLGANT